MNSDALRASYFKKLALRSLKPMSDSPEGLVGRLGALTGACMASSNRTPIERAHRRNVRPGRPGWRAALAAHASLAGRRIPARCPTGGGGRARYDSAMNIQDAITERYPRTCRNGHVITGPQDEKLSGHRQCLVCRRDSQDDARHAWVRRWWFQECGFTKEHAREIERAGYNAFFDTLDNASSFEYSEEWDAYIEVDCDKEPPYDEAFAAAREAERRVASRYPEGQYN
jgi:hypothetical protein